MEKSENANPERVRELLKENGIIVSAEQAEQLLKISETPTGLPLLGTEQSPQIIKGYKVYVHYDSLTEEEMSKKKSIVVRIVSQAMKKNI